MKCPDCGQDHEPHNITEEFPYQSFWDEISHLLMTTVSQVIETLAQNAPTQNLRNEFAGIMQDFQTTIQVVQHTHFLTLPQEVKDKLIADGVVKIIALPVGADDSGSNVH